MSPSTGPEAAELGADLAVEALHQRRAHGPRGHLEQLGRLERQSVGAGGGHDGLADPADPLPRAIRRRAASSSESTSSSRTSGGVSPRADDHLGLGEQEREHREPLLALGAVSAQVAVARADGDVVEVGSEAGDAAFEVAIEASLERRDGRGLAGVASVAAGRPSSPARSREGGRQQPDRLAPRCDQRLAEARDLLGPRRDRIARRDADRDAPERGVPLPHRSGVLQRQRGTAGQEPPERPVEVRAPRRRDRP